MIQTIILIHYEQNAFKNLQIIEEPNILNLSMSTSKDEPPM